jgi:hypothetical protein
VLLALLAVFMFVLVVPPPTSAQIANVPLPAALSANKIPQFAQALPTPANGGIPVELSTSPTISMCEYQQTVLPPGTPVIGAVAGQAPKTWVWGYQRGNCGQNPLPGSYIGPVIVATRGVPTQVTFQNNLGTTTPGLPTSTKVLAYQQGTDQTLMWADPLNGGGTLPGFTGPSEQNFCNDYVKNNPGVNPPLFCRTHYGGPIAAAPHLHGGEIPAYLDGGPDACGQHRPLRAWLLLEEWRYGCGPRQGRIHLPQWPGGGAHLVPRPHARGHAPQCLRGHRGRVHDHRP